MPGHPAISSAIFTSSGATGSAKIMRHTLMAAHYLAWALLELGRYAEARDLNQDTLERRRRVLGDDHPDTLNSAHNLAVVLRELGDVQAARDLDQDTLARHRRVARRTTTPALCARRATSPPTCASSAR